MIKQSPVKFPGESTLRDNNNDNDNNNKNDNDNN